jgi:flagellar motor switch protein FliM
MNINTPLLSAEEMEALRADLAQPKSRAAEPVDLASGDHALRKIVPIIERRLELFTGAVDMSVARGIRESLTNKADPPDVIGPRTASGTMRELAMVAEIHAPDFGLVGYIGIETLIAFLLIERAFGSGVVTGPSQNENWVTPQRQRLTSVERNTLLPMLTGLARELRLRVFDEMKVDFKVDLVPGGLPPELPPQVESTIVWRMRFDLGKEKSGLVLVLLPNILELLITKTRIDTEDLPFMMTAHVSQANVQVTSVLGNVGISVSELLEMKPGDLLRLDRSQEDMVPVNVEGTTKLVGSPIQRNGAFGVEIKADYR